MSLLNDLFFILPESASEATDDAWLDELVHAPVTFTVNSDDALAAWANNTAGNDYSSVYIAAGTFWSSKEVNLTNAGTRVVQGAPNSALVFESRYGLYRGSGVGGPTTWIRGVTIHMSPSSNTIGELIAFHGCHNLIDCAAHVNCENGTSSNTAGQRGNGFYLCSHLKGCTVDIRGGDGHGTAAGAYCRAFAYCFDLADCTGTAVGGDAPGTGAGARREGVSAIYLRC
jgi:hypothetical protein